MFTPVPTGGKNLSAYLVGMRRPGVTSLEASEHLDELEQLAETYGVGVVGREVITLREPSPAYLTGQGKAEEIHRLGTALEADVLIFDDDLTPSQQRNWEKLTGLAVIDRREVILGIFADRAQTREATLQVQLARAEYSLPRLTRAWTHLERQRAAGGARGGGGETQLEVDRRLVRNQIDRLKKELQHVRRVRATQRKTREAVPVPTAALVGYTNAGKSSLLNALTGAGVLEEDKLFATLDPTTRRIELPNHQPLLLTDTVGFIRKLPHDLVEAFKATLEEAQVASLLIHVIDASHPQAMDQRKATEGVLEELNALDKPTVLVLNKVDLLPDQEDRSMLAPLMEGYDHVIVISTRPREGLDELVRLLGEIAPHQLQEMDVVIPGERGDLLALLHRECRVVRSEVDETTGETTALALVPVKYRDRFQEYPAGVVSNGQSPDGADDRT